MIKFKRLYLFKILKYYWLGLSPERGKMRNKNLFFLLVLIIIVFLIFTVSISGQIPNPDSIIYASLGGIESLDPHWLYDEASMQITHHVYENLIKYKKDSISEFEPLLATQVPSIENNLIQDNGLTYIFPIRENVFFHNGNKLTPDDILYSFRRSMILDRVGGPTWMILEPLLGVSSLEDLVVKEIDVQSYEDLFENGEIKNQYKESMVKIYTKYIEPAVTIEEDKVIFHLKSPYSPFLSVIAQNASCSAIIDKEWALRNGAWNDSANEWWNYHDPTANDDEIFNLTNGTGPFKFQKWIPGEMIQLSSFDSYWREPARIDNILIKIIPEWITRKLIFLNGEADLIEVLPNFINEMRDIEGVRLIDHLPTQAINIMHFNWNINPEGNHAIGSGQLDGQGIPTDFFNDIHVRKAFSYLFPYNTFIEKTLQEQGMRISGPMTRDTMGYLDEPDFYYQQDLIKSAEEFKKAWDGVLWEKGFSFDIYYTTGAEHAKTACEMIADFSKILNPKFQINPVGVSFPTLLKELYSGRLTMYNTGWQVDFPDPHAWMSSLLLSNGTVAASYGMNYQDFAQQVIDPLIEKGIGIVVPSEREIIYQELMKISHEHAIALYLCQHQGYHVERDWIEGWYYHPLIPVGAFAGDFYEMYKK